MKKIFIFALLFAWLAAALAACGGGEETTAGVLETEVTFTLKVVKADGSEESHTVTTCKASLAEALLDAGLITGEEGPYGLMVQSVDGERRVYEEGSGYWSLYIGDSMAMTGVSGIIPEEGGIYTLKAEG